MQLPLAELILLLYKLAPSTALLPCAQVFEELIYVCEELIFISPSKVTSSECSRDQPSIVFEDQLETEEECVSLCQTYANIPVIGCTFAAWEAGLVLGTCTLYKEPFANYIAHCQLLSGPPDISGCSVDHPEENSCDGIRFFVAVFSFKIFNALIFRQGECILQGHVSETTESVRKSSLSLN